MILIITDENDSSSTQVMDWLFNFNQKVLRISSSDILLFDYLAPFSDEELEFIIKGNKYKLSDFKSIWYRRSWLNIEFTFYKGMTSKNINRAINYQLENEKNVLRDYILKIFKKKSLNSEFDNYLNKIEVLNICNELKIPTPKTIITTSKKQLEAFKGEFKQIITKNFSPGVFFESDEVYISPTTKVVTDDILKLLNNKFYPMLFQEMIPKSFEIRAFFLEGKYFSSSIFSQNDDQTKIDFRNYNFEKPNRTPPYKLPKDIIQKLDKLFCLLGLNSGSIDIIVTPKGEHVFLEVNPIGLFSQVSRPCNFFIEKEIAKYLKKEDEYHN